MPDVDICMVVDNDVVHDARVRKEAASLAARDWRVVVVGIAVNGPEPPLREIVDGYTILRVVPRLLRQNLTTKFGRNLRMVMLLVQVAACLRRVNAKVYHAHDFTGLALVALAGIWRRPVVYDSHEIYFERPLPLLTRYLAPILRPIERLLAKRATRMIVTSESCFQYFVREFGVQEPVIVRNAVDLRKIEPGEANSATDSTFLVAHSGLLMHGRHLDELVKAFQYLPDDVSLLLAGDGPARAHLEKLADELGVRDRLRLTGKLLPQQMISALRQATIAAVLITSDYTSYRFSLPNKFFEAVAAGLPIIASPIPEVKRLIESYNIGVLCDPTDPRSVAQAIQQALEPDTLARLRANVLHVREDLNWEVEERKLVTLYEEIFERV